MKASNSKIIKDRLRLRKGMRENDLASYYNTSDILVGDFIIPIWVISNWKSFSCKRLLATGSVLKVTETFILPMDHILIIPDIKCEFKFNGYRVFIPQDNVKKYVSVVSSTGFIKVTEAVEKPLRGLMTFMDFNI